MNKENFFYAEFKRITMLVHDCTGNEYHAEGVTSIDFDAYSKTTLCRISWKRTDSRNSDLKRPWISFHLSIKVLNLQQK